MEYSWFFFGFPDSSVGKEPTCNAGDPSSIPGSGRSESKSEDVGRVGMLGSSSHSHIPGLRPAYWTRERQPPSPAPSYGFWFPSKVTEYQLRFLISGQIFQQLLEHTFIIFNHWLCAYWRQDQIKQNKTVFFPVSKVTQSCCQSWGKNIKNKTYS